MKPSYENIELVAKILWGELEEFNPKTKEALSECIRNTTIKYINARNVASCSGSAHDYLMAAKKAIIEWNFSYDEALQFPNIDFGYNPETGKWDGTYRDCKVSMKKDGTPK